MNAVHAQGGSCRITGIVLMLVALLPSVSEAQTYLEDGPYPVGWSHIVLPNAHPGTPQLPLTVFYPALMAGTDVPADISGGPYPVLVFGHGGSAKPDEYRDLLGHIASWGWYVAAPETWDLGPQFKLGADMGATAHVLEDLVAGGGLWAQLVDPTRMIASGHSLGGGAAVQAASLDPIFDGVLALAPYNDPDQPLGVPTPAEAAPYLTGNLMILVGLDDTVTPPYVDALPIYEAARSVSHLRELLVIHDADHAVGERLWNEVRASGVAFLEAYMKGAQAELEWVYGPPAQESEEHIMYFAVTAPECIVKQQGVSASHEVTVYAAAPEGRPVLGLMSWDLGAGTPTYPALGLELASLTVLVQETLGASQLTIASEGPVPTSPLPTDTLYFQTLVQDIEGAWSGSEVRKLELGPGAGAGP